MPEAANDGMLQEYAQDAAEAVRALTHRAREAISAPRAYEVLGSLSQLGHGLPQLFEQLGDGLSRSLDEYEVVDDERDPAVSIEMAQAALDDAARYAREVARLLERAQGAISQQGYTAIRQQPYRVQERDRGVAPARNHSSVPEQAALLPWQAPLESPRRPNPEPPGLTPR